MKPITTLLPIFLIIFSSYTAQSQIVGDTIVCEGETVTYFAPTASGASYYWSITGGSTLSTTTADSLSIKWGTPGTGTILLTVNYANNTSATFFLNIGIHPKPTPVITSEPYATCPTEGNHGPAGQDEGRNECEKVCKLSTLTYYTPPHAGSSYQWLVSGGTAVGSTTADSISVMWDGTPFGSLVVIETNQFGCTDSAELCIEKVDLPVADFSNQSSVCKFSSTAFTNNSTGATAYHWDFGDGNTSTDAHPNHSYSTPGTYTITLIAENDCHCTDTATGVIHVDSLPGPEISCPSTICAFDTATYTAMADSGCTFNWFVNGGTILGSPNQPSVTVAWGAGQMGTLGLYLTGCTGVCTDTTLVQVPIVPATGTISGPSKLCPGECATFSLPKFSGATYEWSLSGCGQIVDSTNCEEIEICWDPNIWPCTDTLFVTYYDSFLNCGGKASFVIRIRPELKLYGNSLVCSNNSSNYGTFSGAPAFWNIAPAGPTLSSSPAPNVSVDWNGLSGDFVLTAKPQDTTQTCSDSISYLIKVVSPPPAPAIIGDTLACPNAAATYCSPASGTVRWAITGGTPTTAIGNCVTVNWGTSPPFVVQAYQQVTDQPFCMSDTTTLHVGTYDTMAPSVTGPDTVCANSTSTYSTTSVYPAGTTFEWSISPANAGAILNPGSATTGIEWGNNAPQTVTVTLTVEICGNALQTTHNVYLDAIPAPTVSQLNDLCDNGGTAQLSVSGGSYTAFSWNGPSSFSATGNPVTISDEGLYQVTVTDANGCTGHTQYEVFGVSAPDASISSPDNLVRCLGTTYTVHLCALGNPNYTYAWSNGATTQCINVSSPGTFSVTVTDVSNNCSAVSNSLTVSEQNCPGGGCNPSGSASFTHTNCNPVSFTNTSTGVFNYNWSFGDGNTSTATNPTHTYAEAGFYYVQLTGLTLDVNGADTCVVMADASVEIPLSAKFDFTKGCLGEPVCFTDMSSFTAGNNITSWSWSFGDGNISSLQNPCHTYSNPGSYVVRLTISNGTCTSDFIDTVKIDSLPTAAFTSTGPGCINNPVFFTDSSFDDVNSWSWNFGDGGTSLNQDPAHGYATAGSYPVQLIVHDNYGCYDSITQNVLIDSNDLGGQIAAYPDSVVCSGTPVTLVAPTCGGCAYQWSTGSTNDSITVTSTGIYGVTITDSSGCTYADYILVTVNNPPSTNLRSLNGDEFCLGEFTNLSGTYHPDWTYFWSSNDSVNDSTTFASVFVNPNTSGTYTYQLVITDTSTGCTDTSEPYTITVHPNPVTPTISAIGSSVVCEGESVMLAASHPDPTVSLQWSTGAVTDTIMVLENGCYQVTATDTNGCVSDTQFCVTVNPLPDLCAFYEGCYDTCRPYVIQGPAGGASYQWLYNGSPISGGTGQDYEATLSGDYAVIVTNSYGCTDTTGVLDLHLYDCPDSLCADLMIDSVSCDTNGNYLLHYKVSNLSQLPVTQVSLEVLPPFLNTPYAPHLSFPTIAPGDTSGPLSATLYNLDPGDSLCFRVHVSAYDSLGREELCCYSDTVCVEMPKCESDTSCCYFTYLGETVKCEQTAVGPKFFFELKVNGCGQLEITSANAGILNINNPYTLTGGTQSISGSYIATSSVDSVLCLTYTIRENQRICFDTTICFPIRCREHPMPCEWEFKKTICEGDVATFNYYGSTTGTTVSWNFMGGIPATATGPGPHNVTYITPGKYEVSMMLTNVNGTTRCIDSIEVIAAPSASITQSGNALFAQPPGMSYQWYLGNPPGWTLIPGAVNQHYKPKEPEGRYCVEVTNKFGCKDTACIDFIPSGLSTIDEKQWDLYPNPNDGSFTLSVNADNEDQLTVSILNPQGKVVDIRQMPLSNGKQQFYIENKQLAAGLYYVQLRTNRGTGTRMFIITH